MLHIYDYNIGTRVQLKVKTLNLTFMLFQIMIFSAIRRTKFSIAIFALTLYMMYSTMVSQIVIRLEG